MGKYANAACDMLRWLHKHDIKGGPVSQPSKRDPVIVVWGMTRAGIEKLPATFQGFNVEGTVKDFDYGRGRPHQLIPIKPQAKGA